MFKTVDLFAGIGGIRLGFEMEGNFQTVYSNDINKLCKITYDLNFSDSQLQIEDIRNIQSQDLPQYDLLLAGFPCQTFSVAGYREGFKDQRGIVYFEIERILRETKPLGFLLENVKNLETHDQGKTFKTILASLNQLGYQVKYQVLNTMNYGNIPQNRERIYLVGFREEKHFQAFQFPQPIPLTTTIQDLLLKKVDPKYYYNNKPLYARIKDDIIREDTVYQWRRKYVRENKNNVFPTLTANMGTGGHNVPIVKQGNIIRKITPKECALIQGFPESYLIPNNIADCHLYQQFGNSVSVTVIQRIAEQIYQVL
jgi:DNA (cytosine-5)-methyltransferase 1